MTDLFGNRVLNGCCMAPHETFEVSVTAVVTKRDCPLPEPAELHRMGMMRSATRQTAVGPNLKAFYETLPCRENEAPWDRALALMYTVSESFSYAAGSTTVSTTAEEAFTQGCGVCQDYAHILLALLRADRYTARYVAGSIPGEGESHAWVEVMQDGCWRGFDPTNHKETDDEYISFVIGRDAADCGLNRGIYKGAGTETQHVFVKMEEF